MEYGKSFNQILKIKLKNIMHGHVAYQKYKIQKYFFIIQGCEYSEIDN